MREKFYFWSVRQIQKHLRGFLFSLLWACLIAGVYARADFNNVDKSFMELRNLLLNPGFEQGLTKWSPSNGGSLSVTTNTSIVGSGAASLIYDATATGQSLVSSLITIPVGAYGLSGTVSCAIKALSGTATHTLGAYYSTGGSSSATITSSTSAYQRTTVYFTFPTSGNIQIGIASFANEPPISIDDCYIGLSEGFAGVETVNSVSTTAGLPQHYEHASIQNNGAVCSIIRQSGNWISSLTRTGAGNCTLTLNSTEFSLPPACTCSANGNFNRACDGNYSSPTTTIVDVITLTTNTPAAADYNFDIMCGGQK